MTELSNLWGRKKQSYPKIRLLSLCVVTCAYKEVMQHVLRYL